MRRYLALFAVLVIILLHVGCPKETKKEVMVKFDGLEGMSFTGTYYQLSAPDTTTIDSVLPVETSTITLADDNDTLFVTAQAKELGDSTYRLVVSIITLKDTAVVASDSVINDTTTVIRLKYPKP
jgi:hypothetical protein